MKITLIATGKNKSRAIETLCADYLQRLKPVWPTTIVELPQAKAATPSAIKSAESQAQLAKVPAGSFLIALDERGEQPTTRQLATKFSNLHDKGTPVCLIIGGAEGLCESVRNKADMVLGLSSLTFAHMMVRPIVLEQIYRCAMIHTGHPYHRD